MAIDLVSSSRDHSSVIGKRVSRAGTHFGGSVWSWIPFSEDSNACDQQRISTSLYFGGLFYCWGASWSFSALYLLVASSMDGELDTGSSDGGTGSSRLCVVTRAECLRCLALDDGIHIFRFDSAFRAFDRCPDRQSVEECCLGAPGRLDLEFDDFGKRFGGGTSIFTG